MPITDITLPYNWEPATPMFTVTYPEIITSPQRTKPLKVGQLVWFWSSNDMTPQRVMVLKIDNNVIENNTVASPGQEIVTILVNSQKKTIRRYDLSTSKAACIKESPWNSISELFVKNMVWNSNIDTEITNFNLISKTYTSDKIDLSYTLVPPEPVEQICFKLGMPTTTTGITTTTLTTTITK